MGRGIVRLNQSLNEKAVDENGEPLVVYHGTSAGGFSIFNTYGSNFGLFGQGSYFTDNREVAESYMEKGKGYNKQVYGVFLNIRHPLDMDSCDIADGWKEALPDDINVEIGEDSTNESIYKSVLESFEYNEYPKSEAQEILYDLPVTLGYDGVTHVGGARYNKKDDTKHHVWVVMEPTQIKSATDNIGEFSGENGDIPFRQIGQHVTRKDSTKTYHEQVESEIGKISDVFHVLVKLVHSLDELPDGMVRRAIENGRNVKGWFDTKTGEVVVYLPNATGEEDAKATFLHEIVAHKGLRALLGEKSYDDEMVKLYGLLPAEERKMVTSAAIHEYEGNVAVAMDEYLAEQAEKDETPSWWNKVISSIRSLLRKMGLNMKLSANDVKYLLWRSRKNLERSNLLSMAEDVAMRYKLGVGEYSRTKEQEKVDYNRVLDEVAQFTEKYPGAARTFVVYSKEMLRGQLEAIGVLACIIHRDFLYRVPMILESA